MKKSELYFTDLYDVCGIRSIPLCIEVEKGCVKLYINRRRDHQGQSWNYYWKRKKPKDNTL